MEGKSLKEHLKEHLPEDLHHSLPRGFEVVGDIAIIEISDTLSTYEKVIAEVLLKTNKNINVVLKKSGLHGGEYRTQNLEWIGGENRKETIYHENNIRLYINPEKVYFSPRLSTERERLSEEVGKGENVLVMFSGAGPYSYVAFRKQPEVRKIISVEINPEGDKYANKSMELNSSIVKKSNLFKELVDVLRNENIYFKEKEERKRISRLKLQFYCDDVREFVDGLELEEKEFSYNHSHIFSDKGVGEIQKELSRENSDQVFVDFDEVDHERLKAFFLVYFHKFDFVCRIKGKGFKFETDLEKNILYSLLTDNVDLEKVFKFDRIFMPLPKDASLFLDSAIKAGKIGAKVHMYDFVHENDFPHLTEQRVKESASENGAEIEIISTRKVGQYSPGKYRVCCDFLIKNKRV